MSSPSHDDIRSALGRIAASEAFRNAPQLVGFITFVVEKTLAGEATGIKGYTIATQALGRPIDFDPQADPIVRVEAGRLRRALDSYYTGTGRDDPLRIVIRRGSYVPQFEWVEAFASPPTELDPAVVPSAELPLAAYGSIEETPGLPPPERRLRQWIMPGLGFAAAFLTVLAVIERHALSAWLSQSRESPARASIRPNMGDGRPVVVVAPFEIAGVPPSGFANETLRSLVIDGLARFDEIAVVDQAIAQTGPAGERYVLTLRAPAAPPRNAGVAARLTHEPSGQVVWVRNLESDHERPENGPAEISLAQRIATAVALPSGVLFADLRNRSGVPSHTVCLVQASDYRSAPSASAHARARECLEKVVAIHPHSPILHANLAALYADEHRAGYNRKPDSLARALATARRAVEIAPESPRANQTLMAVLFASGEHAAALDIGRHALELNPYDIDILADVGARLVQTGRYDDGATMIRRAAAANPVDPPWYDFYLFVAAFMQDDMHGARAAASRITTPDYVMGLLAKATIAVRDGNIDHARELVRRMVALQPEYGRDPAGTLARRNFMPQIQSRLLEALRQAGLPA